MLGNTHVAETASLIQSACPGALTGENCIGVGTVTVLSISLIAHHLS